MDDAPAVAPSQPDRKLEFVEPQDGVFTTYANNLQVGWTAFDVRLLFGEVVDVDEKTVTIEQRAHVTLSWLEAKTLHSLLSGLIERYEEGNGPIAQPKVP